MEEDRKLLHTFLNVAVPVAEVILIAVLVPRLLAFCWPFVVAWILALITSPLVNWIEKTFHIVRRHSSMIMIILMLALVAVAGAGLITVLVIQIGHFVQNLPDIYNTAAASVNHILEEHANISAYLPATLTGIISRLTQDFGSALGVLIQSLASPTFIAAQSVVKYSPSVLVYTVLTIFAAYCMIAEKDNIRDYAVKHIAPYIPEGWKFCWKSLKKEWRAVVGGYILARLKIMAVVDVILFVGFLLLHVQFAFWWTILIGILDFLPVLGVATALIPWAVYDIFVGNYHMAFWLVILYAIISVVRQLIQPKIVSDTMGLSPFKTVILLFLGFRLFGFIGMILSVPVGMLFFRMVDDGIFSGWTADAKELIMLWENRNHNDGQKK